MTFRRACSIVAVLAAALVLSACFTVSKNAPAGANVVDERLVGAWRGVDSDTGKETEEAYLHFQKPTDSAPLRLVWVEDRNYQVYDFRTMKLGGKNVFAARMLTPFDKMEGEMPDGFFLGFYDFKGDDVVFQLLDAKKIEKLIEKGTLKGKKPARTYDLVELTGSPEEIARFMASPEADAARVDEPARIRRVPPAKK